MIRIMKVLLGLALCAIVLSSGDIHAQLYGKSTFMMSADGKNVMGICETSAHAIDSPAGANTLLLYSGFSATCSMTVGQNSYPCTEVIDGDGISYTAPSPINAGLESRPNSSCVVTVSIGAQPPGVVYLLQSQHYVYQIEVVAGLRSPTMKRRRFAPDIAGSTVGNIQTPVARLLQASYSPVRFRTDGWDAAAGEFAQIPEACKDNPDSDPQGFARPNSPQDGGEHYGTLEVRVMPGTPGQPNCLYPDPYNFLSTNATLVPLTIMPTMQSMVQTQSQTFTTDLQAIIPLVATQVTGATTSDTLSWCILQGDAGPCPQPTDPPTVNLSIFGSFTTVEGAPTVTVASDTGGFQIFTAPTAFPNTLGPLVPPGKPTGEYVCAQDNFAAGNFACAKIDFTNLAVSITPNSFGTAYLQSGQQATLTAGLNADLPVDSWAWAFNPSDTAGLNSSPGGPNKNTLTYTPSAGEPNSVLTATTNVTIPGGKLPLSGSVNIMIGSISSPTVQASISSAAIPQGDSATMSTSVGCAIDCGHADFLIDGSFVVGGELTSTGSLQAMTPTGLSVGQHSLVVYYEGNGTYAAALSAPANFNVVLNTLPVPAVNASLSTSQIQAGESAVVSVNVACSSACGQVDMAIDDTFVVGGFVDGNGNITFNTPPSLAISPDGQPHILTIYYEGNPSWSPASTNVSFTVVPNVLPVPTITSVISMNPVPVGEFPTVSTVVGCGGDCGHVDFLVDGAFVVGGELDATGAMQSSISTANLPIGTHTLVANYEGNTSYAPATSAVTSFSIESDSALPIPTVTASLDSTEYEAGQLATLSIQVSCQLACGQVVALVDGQFIEGGSLQSDGSAVFYLDFDELATGHHTLIVSYQGNQSFSPASSMTVAFHTD